MTPSIDAAKKIAKTLKTTVGYLLGVLLYLRIRDRYWRIYVIQ
jgi:hypothetical protein